MHRVYSLPATRAKFIFVTLYQTWVVIDAHPGCCATGNVFPLMPIFRVRKDTYQKYCNRVGCSIITTIAHFIHPNIKQSLDFGR